MNKKIIISIGTVVAFVLIIGGTFNLGSWGSGGTPLVSPDAIGVRFTESEMTPVSINPTVSRADAEATALRYLMDGFEIPSGRGVEENITMDSTTVAFSGTRYGYGDRTVNGKNVWAIIISDPPIYIPCGGVPMDGGPTPQENCAAAIAAGGPRVSVAIDVETGEVVSSQLSGAGPPAAKWRAIAEANPPPADAPTPTPRPTATPAPAQ